MDTSIDVERYEKMRKVENVVQVSPVAVQMLELIAVNRVESLTFLCIHKLCNPMFYVTRSGMSTAGKTLYSRLL
jgi:hypothetical protein